MTSSSSETAGDVALVGGRYRLLRPIGCGAMGRVFAAYDRLAGRQVALKQVALGSGDERLLRALAREFQILGTLRHPHIIEVLDYGVDAGQRPFFAMELLDGARTVLEHGRGLPRREQILLLIAALEALAYLHRRGVLHHDLKPDNLLVAGNRLRLLDFGLAVLADHRRDDDSFGTLPYLAPEVLDGRAYTPAADLYSIGVIGYELILGRHPIPATDTATFLRQLFEQTPDLDGLADEPELAVALGALLACDPAERPASAGAAAELLRRAIGESGDGDGAIRESYLQAAAFVGREAELATLLEGLRAALAGRGGGWLVGGESGVGKSRLLEELRVEALVSGATVLRGQGVEGGGMPYQLWHEPIRRLVLLAPPDEREAAVLKAVVPDLERLLGRAVADAPELRGEAGRQRLCQAVVGLFARQPQPVLLQLEDLHWCGESLVPLRELLAVAGGLPLLIVGSYRDDERPDLPSELPGATPLPLRRLNAEGVAALCRAMLGPAAEQRQLVEFVRRETEGNAFFVVEVMRALAEECGGLDQVGANTLPAGVFSGGVQRIVERRLGRVPPWALGLLRLAAVAGRQLDPAVLGELLRAEPALLERRALESWLGVCAEAAVLTVTGGGWQFAHDKLREGLLRQPAAPGLHRRVAEAIVAAHPDDNRYAEMLAHHWYAADEPAPMLAATLRAVDRLIFDGEYARAQLLIERALAHPAAATAPERLRLTIRLADSLEHRGRYDEAAAIYHQVLNDDDTVPLLRIMALNGLGTVAISHSSYEKVDQCAEQALAYDEAHTSATRATSLSLLGIAAYRRGHYEQGADYYRQVLALGRSIGDQARVAGVLINLGLLEQQRGNYQAAQQQYQESLGICREIGYVRGLISTLINIGNLVSDRGDDAQAADHYHEALALARSSGDQLRQSHILNNLGTLALAAGEQQAAERYFQESMALCRTLGELSQLALTLNNLGNLVAQRGRMKAGLAMLRESLAICRQIGERREEVIALNSLAFRYLELEDQPAALSFIREALALGQEAPCLPIVLESIAAVARLRFARGDYAGCGSLLSLIEGHEALLAETRVDHVEPLLAALAIRDVTPGPSAWPDDGLERAVAELLAELG